MSKKFILFSIFILAFLLRFVGLEKLSPPLNRDEAALGYNAYSLLQTGKDEHGISWPLAFESIGDYKMPGYIYLSLFAYQAFWFICFQHPVFLSFFRFRFSNYYLFFVQRTDSINQIQTKKTSIFFS